MVVLCTLAIGCGPLGPIPGGRLSGEIGSDRIVDWRFASEDMTAELETRPSEPHSVHTWFVALGPDLYVPTSMILGPKDPAQRSWVSHVREDPAVRIRLEGRVFERVARRVEDPAEYDRARGALEAKYEIEESQRDPDRVIWIFRLDPKVG